MDDFFPPFVLEIDVDVGRLASFRRKKSFEEKIRACGIDGGDPEHEANRAVGGAPPALAQDALLTRDAHDFVDREKELRNLQLGNERELLFDLSGDLGRNPSRIASGNPLTHQTAQRIVGRFAGSNIVARKRVLELAQ